MSKSALWTGVALGSSVSLIVSLILYKSLKSKKDDDKPAARSARTLPSDLREEQLSRHTLYFGEDGMKSLRDARVCVVGLGGVGSHTAHMLARSGVGYLRLIDFDQVTLSSLNRHACAGLDDVGIPKVVCLQRFLAKISPEPYLTVDVHVEMYNDETSERLMSGEKFDLVIDAIDDVPTKASLLAYCLKHNIRVLSCMGAGGKADMTRLHISDLRTASRDPLATKLRQLLKKRMDGKDDYLDNMEKLAIIYSSEKTVVKLAGFTEEQEENPHLYGAVDGMRIRVLPVLGTMPAIMGQSLAAVALTELGGKPFQPVTGERVGKNVRNRIFQQHRRREEQITKRVLEQRNGDGSKEDTTWVGPIQIDQDDVEYLMEVWRNRCAVTNARLGTVLQLVRWDSTKPGTCDNLVLMSTNAIEKFDAGEPIEESVRRRIEARLLECRNNY